MPVPDTLTLPGFVNAHTHTFQRALRGRAGGGDFWAWRELMLAEAERQTPATVRELYAATYAEMSDAGYTAVGEFHYLGVDEARAAAEAGARGGHRARAPPRRLRTGRAAADAAGIPVRVPHPAGIAAGRRPPSRSRPPLRSRVPARLARGARPLRSARKACRCTSTRASSRARSRSASPSMAAARSSCSTAPGVSAPTSRSSTRRTPTARSSTCSRRAGRPSVPA